MRKPNVNIQSGIDKACRYTSKYPLSCYTHTIKKFRYDKVHILGNCFDNTNKFEKIVYSTATDLRKSIHANSHFVLYAAIYDQKEKRQIKNITYEM